MSIALKVEGLSKKYLIKHQQNERYKTLRDVIMNKSNEIIASLNPFVPKIHKQDRSIEEFWALRDINFEIKAGDKVGIIGRNGAGKSTLLKLLSRITEPTTGRISYNGKIASLLEVGTGFHPELTGRENIYLNGAILGMSRADINRKFDEIVAFAEVEKFLDTPVKRYSSGMYVRLAFAVAAHIDTEILIVDEVLAVGDAKFQKKSLERMNEIGKSGRTLLFVSHNMGAISELCDSGILMHQGKILFQGDVQHSINKYNEMNNDKATDTGKLLQTKDKEVELVDAKILDFRQVEKSTFDINEDIYIDIEYIVKEKLFGLQMTLTLYRNGIAIAHSFHTDDLPVQLIDYNTGRYRSRLHIKPMFLKAGVYTVTCAAGTPDKLIFNLQEFINFEIEELSINTAHMGFRKNREGLVIMQGRWINDPISQK
jgi:lipopolysaccharide transport system ATP-binding protein